MHGRIRSNRFVRFSEELRTWREVWYIFPLSLLVPLSLFRPSWSLVPLCNLSAVTPYLLVFD